MSDFLQACNLLIAVDQTVYSEGGFPQQLKTDNELLRQKVDSFILFSLSSPSKYRNTTKITSNWVDFVGFMSHEH